MNINQKWLWLFLFLALVFLFRKPLARWLMRGVTWVLNKFGIQVSDQLARHIIPALELFIFSLSCGLALEFTDLPIKVDHFFKNIVTSMIIISLFNGLYRSAGIAVSYLQGTTGKYNESESRWLTRIFKLAAALIGGALVLKVWGIDVAPLVTGFGVVGAALAVAAQDLVQNLFAGMTNLAEKRFDVGDWISITDSNGDVIEGTVEKIALRSTTIRQFDSSVIQIPNGVLANSSLKNFSKLKHRRIDWKISLSNDTTLPQILKIRSDIAHYIKTNKNFAHDQGFRDYVLVDELDANAINLHVRCFTESTEFNKFADAREKLAFKIIETVEKAEARFSDKATFVVEQ